MLLKHLALLLARLRPICVGCFLAVPGALRAYLEAVAQASGGVDVLVVALLHQSRPDALLQRLAVILTRLHPRRMVPLVREPAQVLIARSVLD